MHRPRFRNQIFPMLPTATANNDDDAGDDDDRNGNGNADGDDDRDDKRRGVATTDGRAWTRSCTL